MPDGVTWDQLYDLRLDAEGIRSVQDASMNKPGFGFPLTPFLFGSDDWWSAVDSGEIATEEVAGVISRVYWGSMGDWPSFTLTADDGSTSGWTRFGGDVTRYVEGLCVRVRYALLERKADAPLLGDRKARVVLGVWIERSSERTPLYKGYRGSREPDPAWLQSAQSFSPWDMPAPLPDSE